MPNFVSFNGCEVGENVFAHSALRNVSKDVTIPAKFYMICENDVFWGYQLDIPSHSLLSILYHHHQLAFLVIFGHIHHFGKDKLVSSEGSKQKDAAV